VELVVVEPHEVAQVLSSRRDMPPRGQWRRCFIAVMERTQPLVVAVLKVGDFGQQIIRAREMNPAELKRYEAWEASG
jgi:hypothetical protein